MAPIRLTADLLIQQCIPNLLRNGYGTTTDSTQSYYLNSTMGSWTTFEMKVREYFNSCRWQNNIVLDYVPDAQEDSDFHLRNEQLVCGDEHSVVARFGQHLGHPMTAVYRSHFYDNIRFGDYKAARPQAGDKVPDIALLNSHAIPLMLGEAKITSSSGCRPTSMSSGEHSVKLRITCIVTGYAMVS